MKKSYIALAALLPVIFGAVGYGAGHVLAPAAEQPKVEVQAAEAGPSEAEVILDDLATQAPEHAVTPEDGSTIGAPLHNEHAQNSARPETEIAHKPAPAPGVLTEERLSDASIVTLGKISVPVYRPESITYVVSEVGVAMRDTTTAVNFNIAENASRLRDAILTSMHRAADGPTMKGVNIDTGELSRTLSADLKKDFGDDVDEVLFLSLVKADVPRS